MLTRSLGGRAVHTFERDAHRRAGGSDPSNVYPTSSVLRRRDLAIIQGYQQRVAKRKMKRRMNKAGATKW